MPWCFAIVNGKLAEIYFDQTKRGLKNIGHFYAKKEDYKTKIEQKYIKEDTAKFRFIYRKGKYRRIESKK